MNTFFSSQFKKDYKKFRTAGFYDMKLLFDTIGKLEKNISLEAKFKDHALTNNWQGYRECHLKPDLLLIYKRTSTELKLMRLGSHSELF